MWLPPPRTDGGDATAQPGGRDVNARIVGRPNAESDAAVARFLERWLEGDLPGTAWRTRERTERLSGTVPAAGELDIGAGGPDDEGAVAA